MSDGAPTEFSVHEEAIAQLSQPLRSLLTGGMSEAQTGCVIWKHVGKGTFERFVQFAYTGDYSIPTPTVRKETGGNPGIGSISPDGDLNGAVLHP